MMIRKPYITALLLLLSILMLAVPVVPHHHHGSEAICLKNDLHTGCGETNHHQAPQPRPVLQPADLSLLVSLLSPYTDSYSTALYSPYIESLHGVYIARASGLRAPPSLLA